LWWLEGKVVNKKFPQFPYGVVYYRKSNPPEADLEWDTAQAR
jgi:hypothetical protein